MDRLTENPIMRKRVTLLLVAVFALSVSLHAAIDPADALAEARRHMAGGRYADAATLLEDALPMADAMNDAATRTRAKTALHFYAAVAQSALKQDAKATAHLNEYLTLAPDKRTIDAAKYDARFVRLFKQVAARPGAAEVQNNFASVYPGYASFTSAVAAGEKVDAGLRQMAAIDVLAAPAEKREWRSLVSTPDRQRFLDGFWKKRDPSPDSQENEFHETFDRRVVFAEKTFRTREATGAADDRGRVFILLGEPFLVVRRPIGNRDNIQLPDQIQGGTMVNGTIEQWVYHREQLSVRLGKPSITFRFVSQPGIGEYVLQRQEDAYAMQALVAAATQSPGAKK